MGRADRDIGVAALERALEEGGCPVCRQVQKSESRWLFSLLWENVNSPEARERIAGSWGFCHGHAWGMALMERRELGGNLGTAIIYNDLSQRLLESCRRNAATLANVKVGETCPACEYLSRREADYISGLIKYCAEEPSSSLLRARGSLCMPHFYKVLGKARGRPMVFDFLLAVQNEKLEKIKTNGWPKEEALAFLWGEMDGKAFLLQDVAFRSHFHCYLCDGRAGEEDDLISRLLRLKGEGSISAGDLKWLCVEHAMSMSFHRGESHQGKRHLTASMLVLFAEELRKLKELDAGARGRPSLKHLLRLGKEAPTTNRQCPICMELSEKKEKIARLFLDKRPSRNVSKVDHYLCLPHVQLAMGVGGEPSTDLGLAFLKKLEKINMQLRDYIGKHDWRFTGKIGN
ncbi:MAG: hypothetical protein HYX82_00090, partial [Chloroflexi bacterium]|nr:hypothetical protein [Chloroflexota bacterium]